MKIRDQSNQTIKKKLQEMIFIMCCNFFLLLLTWVFGSACVYLN